MAQPLHFIFAALPTQTQTHTPKLSKATMGSAAVMSVLLCLRQQKQNVKTKSKHLDYNSTVPVRIQAGQAF